MQSEPEHTIVIVTFNRPELLDLSLRSIAELQQLEGLEVVVVDDGSEPKAQYVANKYIDTLVLRYHWQTNSGVASARNAGIEHARGKYISFLADDCTLPSDYLVKLRQARQSNPDTFPVITHNIRDDANGLTAAVWDTYLQLTLFQFCPMERIGDPVVLAKDLPIGRGTSYDIKVFDEIGRFNPVLSLGEDGEFALRLGRAGIPVHFLANRFITHHGSLTFLQHIVRRFKFGRTAAKVYCDRPGVATQAVSWKMARWTRIARRIGWRSLLFRYLPLSPFIFLFLVVFRLGYFWEKYVDKS